MCLKNENSKESARSAKRFFSAFWGIIVCSCVSHACSNDLRHVWRSSPSAPHVLFKFVGARSVKRAQTQPNTRILLPCGTCVCVCDVCSPFWHVYGILFAVPAWLVGPCSGDGQAKPAPNLPEQVRTDSSSPAAHRIRHPGV